jgi:hypothetical protein
MPLEGGGGGDGSDGSRFGILNYIDRDNPSLLGKVDFVGMVRNAFRSIVVLLSLSWAAFVVGIRDAFLLVANTLMSGYTAVYTELVTGPLAAQEAAADAAAGELSVFGLFALPVGVAVALGSLLAAVVVIYVFTGGELF